MAEISVIIPVYNTGNILFETVNTVLEQSVSDFELIIVDDGSSSETSAIIDSLTDRRIRVIHQGNQGVAAARNTGIAAASGKYIALLDHDDLWHKDKLKVQKAILDADESIVLTYSSIECFGKSESIQIPDYKVITGDPFLSELEQNKIHSTSCVMFKRCTVLENQIEFSTEAVPCDDWYFYLQLAQYGKFVHTPDVPVYYRLHESNLSSDVKRMYSAGIWVLQKIQEESREISKQTQLAAKVILEVLNRHLAKHYRGLAYLAVKQRDFSAASRYLKEDLRADFSLKGALGFILFSLLALFRQR